MAFTYDLATDVGKVRFLIPDHDADAYELEDEEIEYFLDGAGTVGAAAVRACRWLARKYAQRASFDADGLQVQHSERAKVYAARAEELARELLGSVGTISLEREDGYSDAATASEYLGRTVYIEV